eukprot:COSAG02_NODE_8802_length_2439_cov_1.494444_3_plen_113_part_01
MTATFNNCGFDGDVRATCEQLRQSLHPALDRHLAFLVTADHRDDDVFGAADELARLLHLGTDQLRRGLGVDVHYTVPTPANIRRRRVKWRDFKSLAVVYSVLTLESVRTSTTR